MYEILGAVWGAIEGYHQEKARMESEQRRLDLEREEDERLLPLMTAEQRTQFLAERKRLNERREDIKRQERHHREMVAAQREIASSVDRAGNKARGFASGLFIGSLLD